METDEACKATVASIDDKVGPPSPQPSPPGQGEPSSNIKEQQLIILARVNLCPFVFICVSFSAHRKACGVGFVGHAVDGIVLGGACYFLGGRNAQHFFDRGNAQTNQPPAVLGQRPHPTAARGIAKKIAANAPLAVQAAKEMAVRSREMDRTTGLRFEAVINRLLQFTEDAKEGPAAFAAKRPANFKGR